MVNAPFFIYKIMSKENKKGEAVNNLTPPPPKNEAPQLPKQKVPQQKTFEFNMNTTPEQMDSTVNPWLLEQSKKGLPAQLGKTFSNHANGKIYIVYMHPLYLE